MDKRCSKCGDQHPATLEFFPPDKKAPTGLRYQCRKCENQRKEAYRKTDKGRSARQAMLARARARNPDYHSNWRAAHPDYYRQYSKKWLAARPGYAQKIFRDWLARQSPEARARLWKAHSAKRKARKMGAGGRFTAKDVAAILDAQAHRCWWCGIRVDDYHVDHRIPLARGGSNGPENIVVSCPPCNLKRGAKMPWEMAEGARLL